MMSSYFLGQQHTEAEAKKSKKYELIVKQWQFQSNRIGNGTKREKGKQIITEYYHLNMLTKHRVEPSSAIWVIFMFSRKNHIRLIVTFGKIIKTSVFVCFGCS